MAAKKLEQTMITKKQYNRRSPSIILEDCDCERDCSWQLNQVAPENLLSTRPAYAKLVREFRGFVNRPHLTLAHVGFQSSLRANWECEDCGNTWATAINSRSDGNRCRKCAMKEAGHEQALRKATGNNYDFIDKAVKVIKYPDIHPKDLPPHSSLDVLWNCRCGMQFVASLDHVATWDVICSNCRAGNSSRFEHEIVSLLRASLPHLTVLNHYAKKSYKKYVDIYVEELDLAIELDTKYYHRDTLKNDQHMATNLSLHYSNLLRVRDHRIPKMENSLIVTGDFTAKNWFKQILDYRLLEKHSYALSLQEIETVLTTANRNWDDKVGRPEIPANTIFGITEAFIRNLTRPGRSLEYTSANSNDTAEFICLERDCGNVYPQRIVRWQKGIRCPKHKGERIRLGRLLGRGSRRLSETHPQIFAELVRVIEDPEFSIEMVSPATQLMCEFKCQTCGHVWNMRPSIRTNLRSPAGCPECKKRRGFDRPVSEEKQLMLFAPDLLSEYVRNLSTPDRPIERLSVTSQDLCEWSCPAEKHDNWFASPRQRARSKKWRHCPDC